MNPSRSIEVIARGDVRVVWSDVLPRAQSPGNPVAEVDRLWEEAVTRSAGHLFNGSFLNVADIAVADAGCEIRTHFDEYKYLYAAREWRECDLGVAPIGVSGISWIHEAGQTWAVVARRANHVTQYPGFLEFVPSGTIDFSSATDSGSVDYVSKLLDELHEEAGVTREYVAWARAIGLVYDPQDRNYDICCEIQLTCQSESVLSGIYAAPEYVEPILISRTGLSTFVHKHASQIIPSSLGILALLNLHPLD